MLTVSLETSFVLPSFICCFKSDFFMCRCFLYPLKHYNLTWDGDHFSLWENCFISISSLSCECWSYYFMLRWIYIWDRSYPYQEPSHSWKVRLSLVSVTCTIFCFKSDFLMCRYFFFLSTLKHCNLIGHGDHFSLWGKYFLTYVLEHMY